MRTTALKVSLLMCALLFFTSPKVGAISADYLALADLKATPSDGLVEESEDDTKEKLAEKQATLKIEEDKKAKEEADKKAAESAPKPPVQHTVIAGDSLSKIATANNTQWKRIFNKNTAISDPDTIAVGAVITIPTPDEVLEDRPIALPEPVVSVQASTSTTTRRQVRQQATVKSSAPSRQVARGSSAGNTYAAGYCTWYVKNRRPDIPNRMGNASAWVSSARSQGLATGSTPQVGAVAQSGNHVAYVESVNGGTVTVSEMNWKGLYVTSSRTAPASSFNYIY